MRVWPHPNTRTHLSTPYPDASRTELAAPSGSPSRHWLRDPLLHFLLLGALLFAIDYAISGKAYDPHTIVVDASVDSQAIEIFQASRGRPPTEAELKVLRQRWIDNEVLYREGLALQVDKGDENIRERVIFKALSIIEASLKLPPYDDKMLRAWFEERRAKYDEPARYDFQEAVLAGDNSEAAMRAFVAALNSGTPPDDAQAGLRVFKTRPEPTIVQSYGEAFAEALKKARPDEWTALQAKSGWHAIRLTAVTAARPADYEVLRGIVLQDWTDQRMAELRTEAVRGQARKYTIKMETGAK